MKPPTSNAIYGVLQNVLADYLDVDDVRNEQLLRLLAEVSAAAVENAVEAIYAERKRCADLAIALCPDRADLVEAIRYPKPSPP
jgi:hypothetical protein